MYIFLSFFSSSTRVNMYSIHGYRSGNPALIYPGETLYW